MTEHTDLPSAVAPHAGRVCLERSAGWEIRRYDRARQLNDELFTGLQTAWPYTCRGELSRLEAFLTPTYLVAVHEGQPAGFLPYYLQPHGLQARRNLGPRAATTGRGLLLGSTWGGLNHLAAREGELGREAVRLLIRHAIEVAVDAGAVEVLAPHLVGDQLDLVQAAGYAVSTTTEEPRAVLPVRWATFDEYVAALPHRHRADIRRERERFLARGLVVQQCELGDVADLLAPMLAATEQRHGLHATTATLTWYLTSVAGVAEGRTTAIVASRDGRPAAFACLWRRHDHLAVRTWGYDAAVVDRDGTYFNMAIYEPAIVAAQAGATSVDLGSGALRSKTRRGAIGIPTMTAHIDPSRWSARECAEPATRTC